MAENEIARRFRTVTPTTGQAAAITDLRAAVMALAMTLEEICEPSRETSLALTHLEESMMWVTKSITHNGIRQ